VAHYTTHNTTHAVSLLRLFGQSRLRSTSQFIAEGKTSGKGLLAMLLPAIVLSSTALMAERVMTGSVVRGKALPDGGENLCGILQAAPLVAERRNGSRTKPAGAQFETTRLI
jgi:hypothetical protein